tara:strand:- start:51 stop:527 length:477 start_codon:yes stop_codon:yes gene_type:complete
MTNVSRRSAVNSKDWYLALVFISSGNAHAVRQGKVTAVVDVLEEVQSSFGTYWNLDDMWIDINLYDASQHENFTWTQRGVWGYDTDIKKKECLFDAGLRLPTLEVQMPKLRKNGSVYSNSYRDKLVKAVHKAYIVADEQENKSKKGKKVDTLAEMLKF